MEKQLKQCLTNERYTFGSSEDITNMTYIGNPSGGYVVGDPLLIATPIVGFCYCSMFCCALLMSIPVLQSS